MDVAWFSFLLGRPARWVELSERVSCCCTFWSGGAGSYDARQRAILRNRYDVRTQRGSYVTCIGARAAFPVLCFRGMYRDVILSFCVGEQEVTRRG